MEAVDLVVSAKWVVPVVPADTVLEDHSVAVHGGKIVALGPTAEVLARYAPRTHSDMRSGNHALIPGFVNAHTHSPMTLLRGFVDNVALMDWLQNYIWPAEGQFVDEQYIRDGTELAVAEMLRSGVTTFIDMYFFPSVTAEVVDRLGVRAGISVPVLQFPTPWSKDEPDAIARGTRELLDRFAGHPRIQTLLAPHAPYTVSDDGFRAVVALAKQRNLRITTHLHESKHEVESVPERPIARLTALGALTSKSILAHMVHLTPQEIKDVAAAGVHAVHCPSSNLKLASGLCPVSELLAAGVNVCLGTDGAASNDDLDMQSEMKAAAFVSKLRADSPVAIPASTILEMATINGARALGWADRIGSLEVGKEADLVSVHLRNAPVYNVPATLVYVGTNTVTDVWVAGRHLLRDGVVQGVDERELTERGNAWGRKIAAAHASRSHLIKLHHSGDEEADSEDEEPAAKGVRVYRTVIEEPVQDNHYELRLDFDRSTFVYVYRKVVYEGGDGYYETTHLGSFSKESTGGGGAGGGRRGGSFMKSGSKKNLMTPPASSPPPAEHSPRRSDKSSYFVCKVEVRDYRSDWEPWDPRQAPEQVTRKGDTFHQELVFKCLQSSEVINENVSPAFVMRLVPKDKR